MFGSGFKDLMKQAQKMQENLQKAQEELMKIEKIGIAGGGMVKVKMNGRHQMLRIAIDPSLLNAESKQTLEELVCAAVNDVVNKIEGASKEKMTDLMSGLELPEGFNLPGPDDTTQN